MRSQQTKAGAGSARRLGAGVRLAVGVLLAAMLAACGGAKDEDEGQGQSRATDVPASREAAARFLTQATFGPTEASVDEVMKLGYSRWIDVQLDQRAISSHRATWEALDAAAKAASETGSAGQDGLTNSFWRTAVSGEDQLRQRVAFALSEIFVISMQDGAVGDNPRAAAAYLDMLATQGLGSYRDLLESVSLHPMMGRYLTSLGNRKADLKSGRVPDENYAREVMQLFSIGLQELELDGTVKMNGTVPRETYTPADIAGLAKVFTGWSWACPEAPTKTNNTCFGSGTYNNASDPDRTIKPMIGYPGYHATEEKAFLGTVIPAQQSPDPANPAKVIENPQPYASLKTALDTLAAHPNVAPFISKLLIQRLVTSNPSPAYVRDVAAVFNTSTRAAGRGDMRAVVKAILLHPEARTVSSRSGKVREPILRLTAFLRAFNFSSQSGYYRIGNTEDPARALAQSPMRSPSVFNFYRPGYVPPGSQSAAASLAAPELQIAHETTAAGYVNYMQSAVQGAIGSSTATGRDLQVDYSAEIALADKPDELVQRMNTKLLYGGMPAALKTQITQAVESIAIRTNNATNTATDKRNRVYTALFLTVISPEFQVQK